ncbi:hypothetical protein B0H10DRAFT_2219656 [Mycena sp. CBHHK59/15]|nr:hypothetical protein B0H10DRAFT_2219656 [Mycena sp. CBHHK59/15]
MDGWMHSWYLLIKGLEAPLVNTAAAKAKKKKGAIPFVKLDPRQAITLGGKQLQVLQSGPVPVEVIKLSDDDKPMPVPVPVAGPSKGKGKGSSFVSAVSSALEDKASGSSSVPKGPQKDDWKHNTLYRELKSMLKEQEKAMNSLDGLKELRWYMPQEIARMISALPAEYGLSCTLDNMEPLLITLDYVQKKILVEKNTIHVEKAKCGEIVSDSGYGSTSTALAANSDMSRVL